MSISCSSCSKELPDDAKFCLHCGTPITASKEEKQEEDVGAQLREYLIKSAPSEIVNYEENKFEIHERAQKWAKAFSSLDENAWTFLLYQGALKSLAENFCWDMEKDCFRTNKPNAHKAQFLKAAIGWYISETIRVGCIQQDLTYSPKSIELLRLAYEDIPDGLRYVLPDFSEIEAIAKEDEKLFPEPQPIRVEVAGTVISFTTDDAVLIVYMDCFHKGKVHLYINDLHVSKDAEIIERSVGDTKICAAVFNRIPMVRDYERNLMKVVKHIKANVSFTLPEFYKNSESNLKYVSDNPESHLHELYEEIVLFKGNVTEIDWRGRK